jgi:hypothetical protein
MTTLTRSIIAAILALSSTWLVAESVSAQERIALNRTAYRTYVKTNNSDLPVGGADMFTETLFSCPTVGTTCTIRGEISVYLTNTEFTNAFYACVILNDAGDCVGEGFSVAPPSVWPTNILYFTRHSETEATYPGARSVSFMKTGLAGGQIHSIKVRFYTQAASRGPARMLTIDVYRP